MQSESITQALQMHFWNCFRWYSGSPGTWSNKQAGVWWAAHILWLRVGSRKLTQEHNRGIWQCLGIRAPATVFLQVSVLLWKAELSFVLTFCDVSVGFREQVPAWIRTAVTKGSGCFIFFFFFSHAILESPSIFIRNSRCLEEADVFLIRVHTCADPEAPAHGGGLFNTDCSSSSCSSKALNPPLPPGGLDLAFASSGSLNTVYNSSWPPCSVILGSLKWVMLGVLISLFL